MQREYLPVHFEQYTFKCITAIHAFQAAIQEKYNIPKSKLRVYFHYQPSYYHLHVHFTHLKFDAPGSGVEKAHLLSDVIDNIERYPTYYQEKTLTFTIKASQGLCKKYQEVGKL